MSVPDCSELRALVRAFKPHSSGFAPAAGVPLRTRGAAVRRSHFGTRVCSSGARVDEASRVMSIAHLSAVRSVLRRRRAWRLSGATG